MPGTMLGTVLRESSLADVVDTLTAEFAGAVSPRAVCVAVRHARRQLEITDTAVSLSAVEELARGRLSAVSFRTRRAG